MTAKRKSNAFERAIDRSVDTARSTLSKITQKQEAPVGKVKITKSQKRALFHQLKDRPEKLVPLEERLGEKRLTQFMSGLKRAASRPRKY